MIRTLPRWLWLLLLCCCTVVNARAENPDTLPLPTSYVNDFAHVLSAGGAQRIEDLCLQVHQKAAAEMVVVTINSLDNGQSVEEFTDHLELHWKVGKKGVDRGLIFVMVLNPHKLRVETGDGLEGILNDAKVGAILDQVKPLATAGNYDQALLTGTQGLANVIAADAKVTLTDTVHTYRQQPVQQAPQGIGLGHIVLGIGFVLLLIILISTGHLGWAFVLLQMFMGGGGGGGGGRDDDDRGGGGFGGLGGGGSEGGGASRDF